LDKNEVQSDYDKPAQTDPDGSFDDNDNEGDQSLEVDDDILIQNVHWGAMLGDKLVQMTRTLTVTLRKILSKMLVMKMMTGMMIGQRLRQNLGSQRGIS